MAEDMSMPNTAPTTPPPAAAGGGQKGDSEALVEIGVCVYPGGKLALRLDGGKKVPVPDLDTAIAAIRRVVESESGGPLEKAEKPGEEGMGEPPAENAAETEKAFTSGYQGPSGF